MEYYGETVQATDMKWAEIEVEGIVWECLLYREVDEIRSIIWGIIISP